MNGSGQISRRAFAGGLALSRARRRSGAGAGLCRARRERGRICRRRARQDLCVSGRSRPASGISHRVVVRDGESQRCQRRRLWRAVDAVSAGHAAGRAAGGLGQPADLDGPRRGHPRRHPSLPAKPLRAAASVRPASRPIRFTPGSMPGKCAGSMAMRDDQHGAARTQGVGRRFQLRAAARRRPAAGAAGRRRLQPQIASANRPRIITASRFSRRTAASPSTTSRSRSPDWPGWTANGAASRWPPDQTGWDWFSLHLQLRRKADAVPDAPEGRPPLRLRQLDRARRPLRRNRLSRHQHDADSACTEIDGRKMPTGWRIAIPARGAGDRDCTPLNARELDGHELSLLGRPDQLCRQPRRIRISGDDGY